MSLFADYKKEREGKNTLELEGGFATWFQVNEETVYLEDLYVVPEKRRSKLGTLITDLVVDEGRKLGCKFLLGSIDTRGKGVTQNMKALLAYGMEFKGVEGSMLYFAKEII